MKYVSDSGFDADAIAARAFDRLGAVAELDEAERGRLRPVAIASDFAIDTLVAQPALLRRLLADDGAAPAAVPDLEAGNRDEWPGLLRRHRKAESTRLVWRDVHGLDDVDATLAGSTALAEQCLQVALEALQRDFAGRHGMVRDADGAVQRLVVFGLGKLGGGELNFSSDVDLVYGYAEGGSSDGARPLDAEPYFSRIGQQLAKLLDEVTVDGFCHRVDLRLRPYGNAGRVAWSFAAMEQYFQHEGRDWERYAWQKARPVAGDIAAGEEFLETLRPFVYRRYLDYGALDGLRAMKAAIAAEVARKELADDIKRGPGGIREIEFLVQALQLIRGGREPELRGRQLQPALAALIEAHQVEPEAGAALADAYRFLRRLENRLQMLRDAQTHALPDDHLDCARVAVALGCRDWAALRAMLDQHRAAVSEEFAALLAPRRRQREPEALAAYWRALRDTGAEHAGDATVLARAGFDEAGQTDAGPADALLRDFARSPGVRGLSDSTGARLDRVLPALLHGAAQSSQPLLALRRLLALLHNILRRSAYLALLDEQPPALARLVEVVSHSALLAERLAAYPLLLDELLDVRIGGPLPDRDELISACLAVASEADDGIAGDDVEAVLNALNEVRQALGFRIAMASRDGRQSAVESTRQLAWLADGVVMRVLALARREIVAAHGEVPGARFAVLGYGSLGGAELGFGSDLDLVFLYDVNADGDADVDANIDGGNALSDGARPLEASRWFARLAQKVVALLGTVTAAGRLFDVDVRLRPDGAKGLLVSTLASFADYQRSRAWNWEHQALVRARCVSGDASLCADFDRIRGATLGRERDPAQVRADVGKMRARMRAELDRSDAAAFDLKQGEGGLVDLEFLLQALVLDHADAVPELLGPRDTPGLVEALHRAGVFDGDTRAALHAAHATLLARGLECTLDRRPRRVPMDAEIVEARAAIRDAAKAQQLDFIAAPNL
ncbi:bifunctional [glutamate--ammonia ligase]-adenylyl-L-tyrosine phosphorylase/[glutamate--ammonia-ligase] adenylyltransferase [Novilysobacter erysipheiresistens]|uniref:bifunctional [glutamate--ammonia ligase]-adenylyl-L-tyrosine phosphorylase/[glutamate--ammonia-ligase] adenylyltransferase n=1 Tax=Novilysobacter erysipheiresistens TaxID=1749332 RepID=UPI003CE50894